MSSLLNAERQEKKQIASSKTATIRAALSLLAILSVSEAAAQSEWGSIGGGWRNIGSNKDAEDSTVISTMGENPSQTIPAGDSEISDSMSGNRALVRSIALRYADHEILKSAGISGREFVIFFEKMIEAESAYNDRAYSSAGAIGLAQLMPDTAKLLGVDPHNRAENVDGGARYLIAQINEFGTLSLAVAAYNAGPGAVRSYGGIPPYRETERHVAKVMSNYERQWRLVSKE